MIKENKMTAQEELSIESPPSKVREVRSFFEDPKRYLRLRGFDVKLRAETVQEMTDGLAFQSALDIGCGDGTISLPLLKAGYRLTLLDLSTGMTRLASSIVPAGLERNVEFVNEDFMKANLAPDSFDLVICIGLLAHVDSPADFLTKVGQVLKPGGALILEFSDCNHLTSRVLRAYQRICELRKPRPYPLNFLSARRVRQLLESRQLRLKSQFRYGLPPFPFINKRLTQDSLYSMVRRVFGNAKRNRNTLLGNEYILLLTNERSS